MDEPRIPFRFALVGAGSVGTAVAELLRRAGNEPVGVVSRSEGSARVAAERLGAPVARTSDLGGAEVILIGAPAAAFEALAPELRRGAAVDTVLWHFSGAHGVGPLAPTGARVVALHPVQACPTTELAIERLPGSAWAVTCTEGLRDWAHEVIRAHLAGMPVDVAEDDRPAWHAASVITSNGAAALLAGAERILAGISVDQPPSVLGPLALGTIRNAMEAGGGAATLTGPLVRGEVDTVRRHIEALKVSGAGSLDAYLRASRSILETARQAGRIDRDTAAAMQELLA